jgi:uncharacterized protein with FMN-binding domain
MRRISMWFIATVAVVVLLFSYRTSLGGGRAARASAGLDGGTANGAGTANPPGIVSGAAPSAAPSAGSGATGSGSAGSGSGTASATPGPTSGAANSGSTVVNGSVEQTRWGPVQVQVTIAGGRITDVIALQVPDGNFRDQEINSYAVPQLRQEVLAAQSARIDTVSGATVTSDGYLGSLQAALDAAHFRS